MTLRTLTVIPARGAPKRVPGKNTKEVAGKPLIAHTIDQTRAAERIDRAIVSTDDSEIGRVAREHGGDVPFDRPAELATDTAPTSDVITHALDWLADRGETFDVVCLVQVTSPLRTAEDIDATVSKLVESDAESSISISKYMTPPQWAVTENTDGYLSEYFEPNHLWAEDIVRSQDTPELSHPNGAVFAATVEAWREYESFYTPRTVGYEMPPERSFDVDEPWELELVRALMSHGE
jgi:N-acylneuraminate cytidylyltransferase